MLAVALVWCEAVGAVVIWLEWSHYGCGVAMVGLERSARATPCSGPSYNSEFVLRSQVAWVGILR